MRRSPAAEDLSVRARLRFSVVAAAGMTAALVGLVVHALVQEAPWWQVALRLLVLLGATVWAVVGVRRLRRQL